MRQHVPLGCAMAVVSAAAAGLHYAHERRGPDKRPLGIVHRDISPSNILVGYDGSIKVVDFGIAKASARQETRSSSLKGKISYMSPEQCKGAEVDRRSDVYSLGVVLYELCTTTRLFRGESDYLVMDQIVNGRVTLPQVRRPELPNELSAIIMRAIAPDPERRYFTADELRVALDHFAAKAALTTSTSAISHYMRKQFGEKPEPWLELEGQDFDSFEEVGEAPVTQSAPSKSWTEMPGAEEFRRSTGSIPRTSTPIPVIAAGTAAEAASRPSASSSAQFASTPPATDSKMGWESQKPAAAPRGFTPAKLAMIVAPIIVLLGVAIWWFAGTGSSKAPQTAAVTPPPVQPAAAAAPVVTPIPEPPRIPTPVAIGSASEPTPPPTPAKVEPPPTAKRSDRGERSAPASSPAKRSSGGSKISESSSSSSASGSKAELPAPTPPAPSPTTAPPPLPTPAAPTPAPPPPATSSTLPQPPPSPAPPVPPQTVAPTVLDANRIGGDKDIVPDVHTQAEISRAGVENLAGTFKICLTPEGAINTVTLLKSTGFASYDTKIQDTIRRTWRYRPFMVNGKPAHVCTAVRFVYQQK